MKTLSDKIQESIIDSDKEVLDNSIKQIAREWMKYATKAYQYECKEGEDYSIDDDGNISIFGNCTKIVLSSRNGLLKNLNPLIKIISLEPRSRCTVEIYDADVAMSILPMSQWGNYNSSNRDVFDVIYKTKQNLLPKHFPMLVHGNIRIEEAGNIDFSIMPNCTGTIRIDTKKCGSIKWPAGFPYDVEEIKIQR